MLPPLHDILASVRVVAVPLRQRFRGIDTREVTLFEGPEGWTEFSPFLEYDDEESSMWLAAAVDFGWNAAPPIFRSSVRVNATLPAVGAEQVAGILDQFPGCRTVKVKVAESGQSLADDVARVAAARDYLGPEGRIRLDANAGWNVDEAEHAIHALAPYDLEYVEQPCATVDELADIRKRVKYMGLAIAADESVRKASDPLEVARAGAANLLVIKAQPLGGIRRALAIVDEAGLPVVISSALETSIGISMGLHLAASIGELPYDCGLATVSLLAADVTGDSLVPIGGAIDVRRVVPDGALLDSYTADPERRDWWRARIERCHALLKE
ncbi:MAG: O-succinylbenzoate synthase [Microbacteriaceae bacterium]|jgi:O-succinylbenzoate synthase|nr:O-succinylbenzoate synthase [Microbacteriaceae bacterium]